MSKGKIVSLIVVAAFILGISLPGCGEKLETIPVTLSAPADGTSNFLVKQAECTWQQFRENTLKYKWQLAKDKNISNIVREVTVAKTNYEYTGTLEYGTTYYWRVMAVEPHQSAWSTTWTFTTEQAPPPPPPAGTPPATSPKTSYNAKTYTNDEYGFIFLYPSSMISAKPKAKYNVFEAADAMQIPAVSASVLDTAKVKEQTEESLKSVGGSDVKEESSEPMTLADGKTKGTFTKLSWQSSGYAITTYSLSAEKGAKTISVAYTNLTDMIDAKIAKEVVSTLTLK